MTQYYATYCVYKEPPKHNPADCIKKVATWNIGDLTDEQLKFFVKKICENQNFTNEKGQGDTILCCTVGTVPELNTFIHNGVYLREVKQYAPDEQYEINEELECATYYYDSTFQYAVLDICSEVAQKVREVLPKKETFKESENEVYVYAGVRKRNGELEIKSSYRVGNQQLAIAACHYAERELSQLKARTQRDTPFGDNFPATQQNDQVPFEQYVFGWFDKSFEVPF